MLRRVTFTPSTAGPLGVTSIRNDNLSIRKLTYKLKSLSTNLNIMKLIIGLLISVLLGCTITTEVYSQDNVVNDHSERYITKEDLESILALLNIDIFKFKVNFPMDQKCTVFLYKQEYEKRTLKKEDIIWGTPSPFGSFDDQGNFIEKPLEIIRITTKNNTKNFSLFIRMGDFGFNDYKLKIDSLYKNPHACVPFKLPSDYKIGSKIPILLIGSFWDSTSKDGSMKVQRFCMEKELTSDFTNQAFDMMPHYFILGIRIDEPRQ